MKLKRNWMRLAAVAIVIAGIALAMSYGPGEECGPPDPGVCTVTTAHYLRLWTIVVAVVIALLLLGIDAFRRAVDEESPLATQAPPIS